MFYQLDHLEIYVLLYGINGDSSRNGSLHKEVDVILVMFNILWTCYTLLQRGVAGIWSLSHCRRIVWCWNDFLISKNCPNSVNQPASWSAPNIARENDYGHPQVDCTRICQNYNGNISFINLNIYFLSTKCKQNPIITEIFSISGPLCFFLWNESVIVVLCRARKSFKYSK